MSDEAEAEAPDPGEQITDLNQAEAIAVNGIPALAFTLQTVGAAYRLHVAAVDIPQLVAFLVGSATAFEEAYPSQETVAAPANYADPVPARGIGFATTDDPSVGLLRIGLAGFHLDFALPSAELAVMGPRIARLGLTLSVDGSRRQ